MSDDPIDFLSDLSTAISSKRTDVERHAEFRQLFLGSDIGKRVLYDILEWGHIWRSSTVRGDAHMTYKREGERNLALRAMGMVFNAPKQRPDRQQSTEKDG